MADKELVVKRPECIELVVKIPEWVYKRAQEMPNVWCDSVWSGIKNGTPLPKGHGRLIDADYKVSSDGRTIDTICGYMAPTLIEADKEVEI